MLQCREGHNAGELVQHRQNLCVEALLVARRKASLLFLREPWHEAHRPCCLCIELLRGLLHTLRRHRL